MMELYTLYSTYVFYTFCSSQIPKQGYKNQYAFMFFTLCLHFFTTNKLKKLINRSI